MEGAPLAWSITEALAAGIGARRPTSEAEARAAGLLADALSDAGMTPQVEPFDAYDTFAKPYGVIAALTLLPCLLPRRARAGRGALSAIALGLLVAEGGLIRTPLSDALATRRSQNVIASVEPRGTVTRTLCLMAHADTSRSGLLFDPRLASIARSLSIAQATATAVLAAEPLLAGPPAGRAALRVARAINAAGLGLLMERELRGVDVPGANDNASGAGAVVQLAAEVMAAPLESTRLIVCICGAEEAGVLGSRAFLDRRSTGGWLFVNFDGVAAPATLRFLPREGIGRTWPADPGLLAVAEAIARDRPELALEPADAPLGLTYDATPVLARGGRALTLVAGDGGRIPNYHQPTDTVENLDRAALDRAVEVGRAMIRSIDRGQADAGSLS